MTIAEWLQSATNALTDCNIPSARLDAQILCAHVHGQSRSWLITHEADKITESKLKTLQTALDKRVSRIPLAYITHNKEFFGHDLYVDERVLCPRAETEAAVEQIIKLAPKNATVLDIGTGSGAIAIALKAAREDLIVTGSEVSIEALEVARQNTEKILGENKIEFIESNLFANIHDSYDVVVANLPYVSTEADLLPEVQNEPHVALFGGGNDALELYRKFFTELPEHLNNSAIVFTESDPWQQAGLIKLAEAANLHKIYEDYFILGFAKN